MDSSKGYGGKKLLVLDTAYCYEAIVKRGLQSSVTCRDLNGYFSHVWSVHPFASLVSSREWGPEFGRPVTYALAENHTIVEGKMGFAASFRRLPIVNFLLAQLDILIFLIWLIKREQISVIRVGDPLYLGLFGLLLARITGVPLVVRIGANNEKIRSTTGKCMMPRLFRSASQERAVEKFVLPRADLVAGANKDNLQFAIDSGARPDKCTLFRYGNLIDAAHFVPPSLRSAGDALYSGKPFIMCIARLEPVKRVEDVIWSLAEIRKAGFDVRALVVGDGRERENLERIVGQQGLCEHVVFCGNRDQQWLAAAIPHASVVLSPHTGRALTEAALGAAPIAAYDVDWQAELIESGVTGELVAFGDRSGLAAAGIRLLGNPQEARRLGENLRSRVLEMMDPDKLNAHERQQYDQLISPGQSAAEA